MSETPEDGVVEVDVRVQPILDALITENALLRERVQNAGGASAIRFKGNLIIVHPDFPPHIWDGKKMSPIEQCAPLNQTSPSS